jgi:predicted amidophosphoribosyltransferase
MNNCTTMQHALIDQPNPICRACHTDAHPASAMQPAFCTECVNAMLHGHDNRLNNHLPDWRLHPKRDAHRERHARLLLPLLRRDDRRVVWLHR